MNTKELFRKLQFNEISLFDALCEILNSTSKDSKMLVLLKSELVRFIEMSEAECNHHIYIALKRYFKNELTENIELNPIEEHVKMICDENKFKSLEDVPILSNIGDYPPEYPKNLFYIFSHQEYYLKLLKIELEGYINPKFSANSSPTPFKDPEAFKLFDYMVENWDYNSATKWGYLWNFFEDDGKITNKTDYETFIRKRYNFTSGKPNYESCISEKRKNELNKLKQEYLKNLDLN